MRARAARRARSFSLRPPSPPPPAGRPFLGICLGLQLLFDGSDENGGVPGLGLIPGRVARFDACAGLPVPHIGWNDVSPVRESALLSRLDGRRLYYVHSFRAVPDDANGEWVLATSTYGAPFVAAVGKGGVVATQFHPEKSGDAGLDVLRGFLEGPRTAGEKRGVDALPRTGPPGLARRVIACLDVRANDAGDLVVTKGDQYDVREAAPPGAGAGGAGGSSASPRGDVRNLGKPVELATAYARAGADEVRGGGECRAARRASPHARLTTPPTHPTTPRSHF